jgi:nicotinate-nucleotide--dimethylbenzimidazole phosphoribosyltransferase
VSADRVTAGAGRSPGDLEIVPLDERAHRLARERQAQLVKPPGALGRLEALAVWLAACTGTPCPAVRARVVVAAADHGVAARGVSAYPPSVTAQMLSVFLAGRGAVSALAAEAEAEVVLVDAGVTAPPEDARIVQTGLRPSRDLTEAPALSAPALERALTCGRALAADAARDGITVLIGGEMGIGNTTPASCLAAVLTGRPPRELVGPGTGLDAAGQARKLAVVERALSHHAAALHTPCDALRRVGGGELAVLCGLALGAGEHGLAFICDGLIATAAAAVAVAMRPALAPRLLAGHRSPEPAHRALLEHLRLEPLVELDMRLGEATGAIAALALLRLACAAHAGMATFAEAGVAGRP